METVAIAVANMMAAATIHRPSKITKFGLEVPSSLTYQGWEPGGEYTKQLVLKNVQLRTKKIRYKLSGGQFSSTVYPQPIVLSAGTSYTLPITFRPTTESPCKESVEIETLEGTIEVPIRAPRPCPLLSLPESLEFSMCAVQGSITVNFEISNIGNVPTDFTWEFPDGFKVSPTSGSLAPKQKCKLTAMFQPQAADVYSAVAVCSYGEGEHHSTKPMRLKGIGKYPHVTVKHVSGKPMAKRSSPVTKPMAKRSPPVTKTVATSDPEAQVEKEGGGGTPHEVLVDFGAVAVGDIRDRWIEVTNVSPVPATFIITPLPSDHLPDSLFSCSEHKGTLQPHTTCRVKVHFSPTLVTSHPSIGYFSVKAQGGLGAVTVKCMGKPIGPQVSIIESVISFGNIQCGKTSTGIMYLENNSAVATVFQLQLDSTSVFHADVLCGHLPAQSSKTITVHFSPHKPIPYCRKVTCLVHHQDPLFVYLIGTGFTETVRPVVLQPKHISIFQSHARSGISKLPPEQLQQYIREGKLHLDANDVLQPSEEFDVPAPDPASSLDHEESACAHYLHSEHEPSGIPHVSTDVENLKFGYCSPNHASDSKLVSITNHTLGTVCCVWMTAPSDTFHIVPGERELPSGKTGAFTINFKPRKPSQFYGKQLECFVFYKALRDYQSSDASIIHPPWCITVQASGHTFAPNTEPFFPRLIFDTKNLVFPATVPGCPVYRTAVLKNTGDTPILFDFSHDPSETFIVKPSHGLLQDSYQLFLLQMLPKKHKQYQHILNCQLNSHRNGQQELLLSGSGEVPAITLTNEGRLFFKPTCVGTTSTLSYDVTNSSRLPIRFEWKMGDVEPGILKVQPASGIILPNETQSQQWKFAPKESKHYALKVVLQANLDGGTGAVKNSPGKHKAFLSVFGQGVCGEIKCNPSSLDCGTVIIGTSQSHILTLTNPTLSTLYYRLHVDKEEEGERGRPVTDSSQGILELSSCEGAIPACSQETIRMAVRPSVRARHCCKVTYTLLPAPREQLHSAKQPATLSPDTPTPDPILCTVRVTGAYPLLSVTDIHGEGVACELSKAGLWTMLSIDQLNKHLQEEPLGPELRYAIATRHSMRRRVPVHTRAFVDFNFGAAPVHSGSSVVHLMLENTGDVPAEWAFQFPMDMHLEPEYWAETGKLDEVERHELDVVSNEVFTVQPKSGKLQPGDRVTVKCSYKHSQIGTSKLPVLLKINRGREILLNCTGVTVDCGQSYMHFTSHQHTFSPVPIGAHAYPRQVYELHNAGDSCVEYRIDTQPLEVLRENNYLMSILECLQPSGEIPAGRTIPVQFVFSPLEAKRYVVDLPIHFSPGEMVLVTFSGEGYTRLEGTTLSDSQDAQSLPVHRAITISGQPAHLSQERISFSHLPLFSVVRRVVFISNTSLHTLSFQWELNSETAKKVLSVQPVSGYIQPQQSTACRFTFCSYSSPSFYNMDILCKVTDESELLSYQQQLQEWERLEEEERHTFNITDTPEKRPHTMPSSLKPVGSKSKLRPKSSELRGKYQTLPPIGSSEETYEEWKRKDLSIKSKTRPRKRKESNHKPPIPPQSLVLHLGVTARTYSIPDYVLLFDNFDSFYINQHALGADVPASLPKGESTHPQELRVKSEEKEMLLCVLSQMIRELLEDSNFHSAVQRVVEEPIPYFTQFSSCPQPSEATIQSAHQHLYATALEDIPPEDYPQLPHSPPTSQSQCLAHSDLGSSTVHSDLDLEPHAESVTSVQEEVLTSTTELDSRIKHLPEFSSLVESIIENTVLNILMEASCGELNITAPMYKIAKPPPKALGTDAV